MTRVLMRSLVLALAAGLSSYSASAKNAQTASLQFQENDAKVQVRRGEGPIPIAATGLTDIDRPATFDCDTADGCLIMIEAVMDMRSASAAICAYVDGDSARPSCGVANGVGLNGVLLQSKEVGQGRHSVQIKAQPGDGPYSGYIGPWGVKYTLYVKGGS